MNSKKTTFFCTRPRLASLLMEKGYDGKLVPNPYDLNRAAWSFQSDEQLSQIVSDYMKKSRQGADASE